MDNDKKQDGADNGVGSTGGSAFDCLTAKQLADFIDRHCLQVVKGGYAWRDSWEVNKPAPNGHYMECAERTIAYGRTATEALRSAYEKMTSPNTKDEPRRP